MPEVYRRERIRERVSPNKKNSLKSIMLKQSMVCAVILTAVCGIKVSPNDTYVFPKKAISFILTHNTDIKGFPNKAKEFSDKYISENKDTKNQKVALLDMVLPIKGTLESPFGSRLHPIDKVEKFHYGVDISAPEGTKVYCAQKGVAKEVGENGDYGKYITVDHGDGIVTLYAHLSEVLAKEDDKIDSGQLIAESGQSGNVTGPHLHFELKDGENWLNPTDFIDFDKGEGA